MQNVINIITVVIVVVMLLCASYYDIREKRIPNFLTFSGMGAGIIINIVSSGLKGLQFSIIGFLFGIAVFFIPFAFNFMGAGDVKLMGAVGALMGWEFTLSALLYAAIAGGIIVIILSIFNKRIIKIFFAFLGFIFNPLLNFMYKKTLNQKILKLKTYLSNYRFDKNKEYIPYGVAITIGTVLVLFGAVNQIL